MSKELPLVLEAPPTLFYSISYLSTGSAFERWRSTATAQKRRSKSQPAIAAPCLGHEPGIGSSSVIGLTGGGIAGPHRLIVM